MKEKNVRIFKNLEKMHPSAECELVFSTPFELLMAVILSAQCTDNRVNKVTKELFKVASTPEAIVAMPIEELEKHIFSCGFYHNKATALKQMSAAVLELGGVPRERDELMKLRGVGRKTANVVCAVAYGDNTIPVDTHVFRVSHRLGLSDGATPLAVENDLMRGFDENEWSHLHHLLIFHGRYTCTAKNPKCGECELKNDCKYYKNGQ